VAATPPRGPRLQQSGEVAETEREVWMVAEVDRRREETDERDVSRNGLLYRHATQSFPFGIAFCKDLGEFGP
jgi:hypothetical protein